MPSIPRIQVEGPRPRLTPKDNAWCWAKYINADIMNGPKDAFWVLISNTKHPINFWPDYYHRTYQLLIWNPQVQAFYWYRYFSDADCDA
jgi:hypothetical protein